MRRLIILVVVLLLAVLMAFSYASIPTLLRGSQEGQLPTLRAGRTTLTESTVAIGTIKSKVGAEVKVGSRLSGVLAQLRVNIGDEVSQGDVLALLEDAEWRARVDVLEAELASALAELEYAEDELRRIERLSDLVPQIEIENGRKNVEVRRAITERTRASLAEAKILLGYTVIRAPVSGTIASVSTYEGETVAASFSAPTFVTIVDLNRLEVQAYVDETDIGKVYVGQSVSFRVDAYAGHELEGAVQAIYPKAELLNNVVNYVVIIDIAGTSGLQLRPEMTAHVNFILDRREDVISIPRSALLRERGENFVIVRTADGWRKRPVEIGLQTPQRIEIISGIEEGEVIVTDKQAWKDHSEGAS